MSWLPRWRMKIARRLASASQCSTSLSNRMRPSPPAICTASPDSASALPAAPSRWEGSVWISSRNLQFRPDPQLISPHMAWSTAMPEEEAEHEEHREHSGPGGHRRAVCAHSGYKNRMFVFLFLQISDGASKSDPQIRHRDMNNIRVVELCIIKGSVWRFEKCCSPPCSKFNEKTYYAHPFFYVELS